MSTIAQFDDLVITGVDTHKETHVAVAIDHLGRRLGEMIFPATTNGYDQLVTWVRTHGTPGPFGVEGTGSYGSGLARHLGSLGHDVKEINRPDRSARRLKGKSDPVDAESAARAVLSGIATAIPKSGNDKVEMIRLLRIARNGAMDSRTRAITTLKSTLPSLPAGLSETLIGLTTKVLVDKCAAFRIEKIPTDPTHAAKIALRSIAKQYKQLAVEIKALDAQLNKLISQTAPKMLELFGVGPGTAAVLLVAAGDNPERLGSEAAFAALCGVSPIDASSGKTNRHRLNRGGNRQANSALFTIVLSRIASHEPTQKYFEKRLKEGRSKREIMRCLKRYVAREIYKVILSDAVDRALKTVA